MRVGMYNRYLATLGGGERLSLAIAEYLSRRHPVTVISHTSASKTAIEKRFGLDLSCVELLNIPERAARDMTPITSDYDFFINVTDMMYFPSLAPLSVNLVYFPAAILPRTSRSWRWRLKMAARDLLELPAFTDGLRRVEPGAASLSWVMESPATIRLPATPKGYRLSFQARLDPPAAGRVDLYLDEERLGSADLTGGDPARVRVYVPEGSGGWRDLTLRVTEPDRSETIHIDHVELDRARHRLYRLAEPYFKGWAGRLYYDLPRTWILDYLKTYDAIWSVSEYTRSWIESYWGRESHVLYAPVEVGSLRVEAKRSWILTVGRFFDGRHNKKHLEMIAAFKEMVDGGLDGWELHLAGGSTPGASHLEYLDRVRSAAEGYPITLHVDLPFERLVDLYAKSAIYWHATGCGERDLDPARLEHFGISTIEAMAAGCVPVVIAKGGQPEIVQPGHNGFLWRSTEELTSLTRRLTREPELTRRMSAAAVEGSRRFDRAHFQARLQELLRSIGV